MNEVFGLNKLIADIREIAHRYRTEAAIQLNTTIVDERWEIGKRIVEEEQKGEARAEYGTNLLRELSKRLTIEMGKGYSLGHWLIIVNSMYTFPTERFCRRVCKISHGLIYRLFLAKRVRKPDYGIWMKPRSRCGRSRHWRET